MYRREQHWLEQQVQASSFVHGDYDLRDRVPLPRDASSDPDGPVARFLSAFPDDEVLRSWIGPPVLHMLERELGDAYLACYQRNGYHTETGFWLMDCTHRLRDAFLDTWVRWLESGTFKTLHQWCDASTLNATLRAFEKDKLVTSVSLSGPWEKEMHPMAKVELRR